MRAAIVLLIALVHVVLAGNVIPVNCPVRKPEQPLGKSGRVVTAEDVVICHDSPNSQCAADALLNVGNIYVRNELFDDSGKHVVLVGSSDGGSINSADFWQWICKRFCISGGHNLGGNSYPNITSRRRAGIYQTRFPLKFNPFRSVLVNSGSYHYGQVRTHDGLIPTLNDSSYLLHRICGTRGFPNVALHRLRLFSSSFHGFSQFLCLIGVHKQLKESDQGENAAEPNQMPIIRRFLLALFSLFFGFLLSLRGWQYFDGKRRLLGAALVGSGALLGGAGLLLYWLTLFPRTWVWLL